MTLAELDELIELRRELSEALRKLEKMRAICGVSLYYNGHQSTNLGEVTVTNVRETLVKDAMHQLTEIQARMRQMGVET